MNSFKVRMFTTFRTKVEGKANVLTIWLNERTLEAIKSGNFRINFRFGTTSTHLQKEKSKPGTSGDIWDAKSIKTLEGIVEVIEAERTGLSREADLLSIE